MGWKVFDRRNIDRRDSDRPNSASLRNGFIQLRTKSDTRRNLREKRGRSRRRILPQIRPIASTMERPCESEGRSETRSRAARERGVRPDLRGLDDVLDNRQSHSGAVGACGEERVEHSRRGFGRNARSVVFNLDANGVRSERACAQGDVAVVEPGMSRASVANGLQAVLDEIRDDLLQLNAVNKQSRQVAGEIEVD